jgi:hypothetical protein
MSMSDLDIERRNETNVGAEAANDLWYYAQEERAELLAGGIPKSDPRVIACEERMREARSMGADL